MNLTSPLRYPGGKAALADLLAGVISASDLRRCCMVEPYAGGAGAALNLLVNEHVDRIIINDADVAVSAFWASILSQTDEFIERVQTTPLTTHEWYNQREIYRRRRKADIDLGFATFYLNRCNRSGVIVNGGMIGGKAQSGRWGLGARFDREALVSRINDISAFRDRIQVSCIDGLELLSQASEFAAAQSDESLLCFIDPPYVEKGRSLYYNGMQDEDHEELSHFLRGAPFPWILTYDDCSAVRDLYSWSDMVPIGIAYTAANRRMGDELLMASRGLKFPTRATSAKLRW